MTLFVLYVCWLALNRTNFIVPTATKIAEQSKKDSRHSHTH